MIALGGHGGVAAPGAPTVASRGDGVDELLAALASTPAWPERSGEGARRRAARAEAEMEAIAVRGLRARIGDAGARTGLADLAKRVVAGGLDPYAAADESSRPPRR